MNVTATEKDNVAAAERDAERPQMTNETYPETDVRVEDRPAPLEEAAPSRADASDVGAILGETGVSGGSDNTAQPSGGNYSHRVHHDHHEKLQDSEAARENYEGDQPVKPGVTGAGG